MPKSESIVEMDEEQKLEYAKVRASELGKYRHKINKTRALQRKRRRERVYELMLRGYTWRQIAEHLGVSTSTVSKDVKSIRKWYKENPESGYQLFRETIDSLRMDKVMQAQNLLAAEPGTKEAIMAAKEIAEIDKHVLKVITPTIVAVGPTSLDELIVSKTAEIDVPDTPAINIKEYMLIESGTTATRDTARTITEKMGDIQLNRISTTSGPDSVPQGYASISAIAVWA
jgi:transposase